jgi:hypothetical protein
VRRPRDDCAGVEVCSGIGRKAYDQATPSWLKAATRSADTWLVDSSDVAPRVWPWSALVLTVSRHRLTRGLFALTLALAG